MTTLPTRFGVKDEGWDASIYGENLGDTVPCMGAVPSLDGVRVFATRSRTIGGLIRADF